MIANPFTQRITTYYFTSKRNYYILWKKYNTYCPMLELRLASLFWSILRIVSFWRSPNPSGNDSIIFSDRWRSVKLIRPPISAGTSSNLFSDTSKHANFFKYPNSWKKSQHLFTKIKILNICHNIIAALIVLMCYSITTLLYQTRKADN